MSERNIKPLRWWKPSREVWQSEQLHSQYTITHRGRADYRLVRFDGGIRWTVQFRNLKAAKAEADGSWADAVRWYVAMWLEDPPRTPAAE